MNNNVRPLDSLVTLSRRVWYDWWTSTNPVKNAPRNLPPSRNLSPPQQEQKRDRSSYFNKHTPARRKAEKHPEKIPKLLNSHLCHHAARLLRRRWRRHVDRHLGWCNKLRQLIQEQQMVDFAGCKTSLRRSESTLQHVTLRRAKTGTDDDGERFAIPSSSLE